MRIKTISQHNHYETWNIDKDTTIRDESFCKKKIPGIKFKIVLGFV